MKQKKPIVILILLAVFILKCAGSEDLNGSAGGQGHRPKLVVVTSNNPGPMEQLAGQELVKYGSKIFAADVAPVTVEAVPASADAMIIIGPVHSNSNINGLVTEEKVVVDEAFLGDQGFVIKKLKYHGHDAIVISGKTDQAVLYGVYTFLEEYGCGFYFSGDVVPDKPAPLELKNIDLSRKPKFAIRGFLPWFNFFDGPSSWSPKDYRGIIDQMVKMKCNFLEFHFYSYEAFLDFEYKGLKQRSGILDTGGTARWGSAALPTKQYIAGQQWFAGQAIPASEGALGCLTQAERFHKAQIMLKDALGYAHSRGLETMVGFEVLQDWGLPQEFVHAFPKANDPDDPDAQGIMRARFRSLVEHYPDCKYYCVWMNEAGGNSEVYTKFLKIADDELKTLKPGSKLVTGGWSTQSTWEYLDKHLPKDIILHSLLPCEAWRTEQMQWHKNMEPVKSGREMWNMGWLEFDGRTLLLQPKTSALYENFKHIEKIPGSTGMGALTWMMSQNDDDGKFIAEYPWHDDLKPEEFFTRFVTNRYGAAAAAELVRAFTAMDAYEKWLTLDIEKPNVLDGIALDYGAPNIIAVPPGFFSFNTKPDHAFITVDIKPSYQYVVQARDKLNAVLDLIHSAREKITDKPATARLDYYINRVRLYADYMNVYHQIQDAALTFDDALKDKALAALGAYNKPGDTAPNSEVSVTGTYAGAKDQNLGNIAYYETGTKVTASSTAEGEENSLANINDGSIYKRPTRWHSRTDVTGHQWVEYAFPRNYTVDRIVLHASDLANFPTKVKISARINNEMREVTVSELEAGPKTTLQFDPLQTDAIRLDFLANNSKQHPFEVSLNEVEIFQSMAGSTSLAGKTIKLEPIDLVAPGPDFKPGNIAYYEYGTRVRASSEAGDDNRAIYLIDGLIDDSMQNRWHSDLGKPLPVSLEFTFVKELPVNRIVFHGPPGCFPTRIKLSKMEGGSWKEFLDTNLLPAATVPLTFATVTTRAIRIDIMESSSPKPNPNYCQLTEVEMFVPDDVQANVLADLNEIVPRMQRVVLTENEKKQKMDSFYRKVLKTKDMFDAVDIPKMIARYAEIINCPSEPGLLSTYNTKIYAYWQFGRTSLAKELHMRYASCDASFYNYSFPPDNMLDGRPDTYWTTTNNPQGPVVLYLQTYAESMLLDSIQIVPGKADRPKDCRLLLSSDGKNFQEAAKFTINDTEPVKTVSFDRQSVCQARLVIASWHGAKPAIAEVIFPSEKTVMLDENVPLVNPSVNSANLYLSDNAFRGDLSFWVYPYLFGTYQQRLNYAASYDDAYQINLKSTPKVTWAWRKEQGEVMIAGFMLRNNDTGVNVRLLYAAGTVSAELAPQWPIQYRVADNIPQAWQTVERNIMADAQKAFGWTTDNITATGIQIAPVDGICGYLDAVEFRQ